VCANPGKLMICDRCQDQFHRICISDPACSKVLKTDLFCIVFFVCVKRIKSIRLGQKKRRKWRRIRCGCVAGARVTCTASPWDRNPCGLRGYKIILFLVELLFVSCCLLFVTLAHIALIFGKVAAVSLLQDEALKAALQQEPHEVMCSKTIVRFLSS